MNTLPDPELCKKYAQFASHMVRWQFKIIYWTMFLTNLVVLFVASWIYIKGQETLERFVEQPRKRSRRLRIYIGLCLGCVLISACVTVMEAYSLLALQFCDGEDLMSLYWSTWTMIQVGSLIAIVGIILAMLHSLQNRRHPPWALALGTPVLVIAGFLHLFHDCTKARVSKIRKSSKSTTSMPSPALVANARPSTSASQTSEDETMVGEFIGFTVDGGPIVRFQSGSTLSFDENAEVLGYCDGERPLVAYRKDSIQFITDTKEKSDEMV